MVILKNTIIKSWIKTFIYFFILSSVPYFLLKTFELQIISAFSIFNQITIME